MRSTCEHGWTRIWTLVLSVLSVSSVLLAAAGAECAQVRAAWVSGWGKGVYTRAEVDRAVAAAKAAKLNLIFFDCRKAADAHYRGGMEPVAKGVEPGFDPLGYAIRKAHAENMKVHAWASVYRIARRSSFPEDATHLANRHRDWLSRSYSGDPTADDGIFVDPGVPEAAAYTTKVIVDIVSRYDVDGLQLDFIRYPHAEWGYATAALKRYFRETGARKKPLPSDPKWREWRRRQVTLHVAEVRHAVHCVKPRLPISAATICWGDCPTEFAGTFAYKHLGQDWKGWLARGLIDANCPMNYRRAGVDGESGQFSKWLASFRKWGGGKPVYVGVAAYRNDAAGVLKQIDEIGKGKMDGFAVFSFNESWLCTSELRKQIAQGLSRRTSP